MTKYVIGDVQGCYTPLQKLLSTVNYSPSRDHLYFLGDVVNRGTKSLKVLQFLHANAHAVSNVLGNHDIHLLAYASGARPASQGDTLDEILQHPQNDVLLSWLASKPFAIYLESPINLLLIHAGVLPSWTLSQTLTLAKEAQTALADHPSIASWQNLFGNMPNRWSDSLQGAERLRVIINALTRLRFCTTSGVMDFHQKGAAHTAKNDLIPWFDVPNRATHCVNIAFGHWSTLGWLDRSDLFALDTGCVWGGALTMLKLDESGANAHEKIQIT